MRTRESESIYNSAISRGRVALGAVLFTAALAPGCAVISRYELTTLKTRSAQYQTNQVEITRQEREEKLAQEAREAAERQAIEVQETAERQAREAADNAELSRLSNLPALPPRYSTSEPEFRQPRAQPSRSYPAEDGFPWGEAAAALVFTIFGVGTVLFGLRYMTRDHRPTRPTAGGPAGEARPVD